MRRLHRQAGWILVTAVLVLVLATCATGDPAGDAVAVGVVIPGDQPAPSGTPPSAATVTAELVISASPTPEQAAATSPEPSATVVATATASQPAPTATPTPDLYEPLTIEALSQREYGGGLLEIVEQIEETETFARYLIRYPSDGLDIYGFMNVPHEGTKFPVAVVLHGYVPPSEYDVVPYTRRYADDLVEAGYFVIHPNFRNYPPSDSGEDPFRTGYAIDVLNLLAIIREQSQDPLGTLRRADATDINLWGHSMGGGVALRVATVDTSESLRTIVLYGSMSGDESLNYGRIRRWSNGRQGSFEMDATAGQLAAISPIEHLDRLEAAVAVHHSHGDETVPIEWSLDLCERLEALYDAGRIDQPPDCYFYELQPHTFRGDGDRLFMYRVREFLDTH